MCRRTDGSNHSPDEDDCHTGPKTKRRHSISKSSENLKNVSALKDDSSVMGKGLDICKQKLKRMCPDIDNGNQSDEDVDMGPEPKRKRHSIVKFTDGVEYVYSQSLKTKHN